MAQLVFENVRKRSGGQGTVSGQAAALSQAIALKPDAIIVSGSDAVEQKAALEGAAVEGITVVGWRTGPVPGLPVFANVDTDSMEVARVAAMKAVADANGTAGVVTFADSPYAMAIAKGRAVEGVIRTCAGCKVLDVQDTPLADVSTRVPQLTTTILRINGAAWTHALAINDFYHDLMPPSLSAAGLTTETAPQNISAGDGSEPAFPRIHAKDFPSATVPEPLAMQGRQVIDELNRAFSKQPWSGYVPSIHLVTADTIELDGEPKNVFDPDNGHREACKVIWSKN